MPVPRAVATAPVLLLAQRADPVEIDWEATRRGLERRVEDDPADAAAWRRLGDAQARLGRPREALAAYRRAESLGLRDEDLRMAIGDALKDLERHGEAYRAFAGLLDSSDPERRLTACQQVQYLAPYRFQRLAPPTFADLYVQAGRQSIASAAYVDAVARWGVNLRPREQLQLYGIARFTRDNRSGLVGGFPLEYFDNAAVLGAGVRYRPLDEVPLYLVAEAGWSRDLEDLGRDRNRSDVRAGVSFYQEWFTERACTPGATYPMRFVMTVSAESMFRSRLRDTVITTADLRPGIRLRETAFSSLDLFAVGTVFTDSRADRFVQYAQFGAALAWVPDGRYPLKIVGEALRTDFTTGDDATNYNLYLVYSVAF
ncbi:MAG TPA: bacterial transcriptional activator domain-containing protein, partial [Gemmatimonadales bacterium]|nr:bacterial transcriptional activator domain-containing protein [Gemmatimonadales bacterium]